MNNVVRRHANDDDSSVASRACNNFKSASSTSSEVATPPNTNFGTDPTTDTMAMMNCWKISKDLEASFFPALPSSAFTPCPSFLLWMRPDLRVVVVPDDENPVVSDALGATTAVVPAKSRTGTPRMATVASRPVARVGEKCGKRRRSRVGGCRREFGGGCTCRCKEWFVRVIWVDGEGGGEGEWVRCARCLPAPAGFVPKTVARPEQRQQIGPMHQENQLVQHRKHLKGRMEGRSKGPSCNYAFNKLEVGAGGTEDGDGRWDEGEDEDVRTKRRRKGKRDGIPTTKSPRTLPRDVGCSCPDVTARPTLDSREENGVDVRIVSAKKQGPKVVLAKIFVDDIGERGKRRSIVTVVTTEVSKGEDPPCHTSSMTGVSSSSKPATSASKPPQPRSQTKKIGGMDTDALEGGPLPASSSIRMSRIVTPPGGDGNDSEVADILTDTEKMEDGLESDVDYNNIFEDWSGNVDNDGEPGQDSCQDCQPGQTKGHRSKTKSEHGPKHMSESHGADGIERPSQSQGEEGGEFNFFMDKEDSPVPPALAAAAGEGDNSACITPNTVLHEVSDEDSKKDIPLEPASPVPDACGPLKTAIEEGGVEGRGSDPDRTTPPALASTCASGGGTVNVQNMALKATTGPTHLIAADDEPGGEKAAPPVTVTPPTTTGSVAEREGSEIGDAKAAVDDTVAAKATEDEILFSPESGRSSKWTCPNPSCGRRNKRSRKRCKECRRKRILKIGERNRRRMDHSTSEKDGDDEIEVSFAAGTGKRNSDHQNSASSSSSSSPSLAVVFAKKRRRCIYSGFDDEDCVLDAHVEDVRSGHGCAADEGKSDGHRCDDPKEEEEDRLTCFHENMKYPVGTEVSKLFFGQRYSGMVVGYDPQMNWYQIAYDDGDQEELGEDELGKWLVVQQSDDKGTVAMEKEEMRRSRLGLRKVRAIDYSEDHAYDELSKVLDKEEHKANGVIKDESFLKKKVPTEELGRNQKSFSGSRQCGKRGTQCALHLVALPPTARPGERLLTKLRQTDGFSVDEDLFVTCPSRLSPESTNKSRLIRVICPMCSIDSSCWKLGVSNSKLPTPSGVQKSNSLEPTSDGKRPHLFVLHSVLPSAVKQIAHLLPPAFKGRQRVRTAEAVGHFFLFCHERQLIWERKNRGDDFPLTQDPLMASEHFCNIYRELDRGTVYFRAGQGLRAIRARENEQVVGRGPRAQQIEVLVETLWASLCYRLVNKVETFERFGGIPTMDEWPKFVKKMKKLRASGFILFTGAHQVVGWDRYVQTMEELLVFDAARIRTLASIAYGATKIRDLQRIFDALVNIENVGRFFAWQVICDLLECNVLDPCTENDWVELGPGAKAGIKQIFADSADCGKLSLAKFLRENQDGVFAAMSVEFPFLNGVKLTLKSIEHALCEYDKYERMRTGKNRKKRLYRHSRAMAGS